MTLQIISKKEIFYSLFVFLLPFFSFRAPLLAAPCEFANRALAEAERIRGIKAKEAIDCIVLQPEEFRKRQKDHLFAVVTRERLDAEARTFQILGFIPRDYDYERCYVQESLRNMVAYYDVLENEVVLPSWMSTAMETLVHESVHALQDQHFGLDKLSKIAFQYNDSALALSALAEGDAITVQHTYVRQTGDAAKIPYDELDDEQEPGCKLPPALQQIAYFPYQYGLNYVQKRLNEGKYPAVSDLYNNIPSSTAEILGLPEYQRPEHRIVLKKRTLPPLFDESHWKRIHTDILGPYIARVLLQTRFKPSQAIRGILGWRDDVIDLYRSPLGHLAMWTTDWRQEQQARAFYYLLLSITAQRAGLTLNPKSDQVFLETPEGMKFMVRLNKSRVQFAIMDPQQETK